MLEIRRFGGMSSLGLLFGSWRILQPVTNSLRSSGIIVRCMVTGIDSDIPKPPKRPLTGYLRFYNVKRDGITSANPGIRVPELGKLIGDLWRRLPKDEKEEYISESLADWQEYRAQFQSYKDSLTAEQQKQLQENREQQRKQKSIKEKKKMQVSLDRPRRPANSYGLFIQETGTGSEGLSPKERLQKYASDWHRLPEAQKEEYRKVARTNFAQYEEDMLSWERQMILSGHQDLIRDKSVPKESDSKATKGKSAGSKKTKAKSTSKKGDKGKTGQKKSKETDPDPSWMKEE